MAPLSFQECLEDDLHQTFLSTEEFGEVLSLYYDGVEYPDVLAVLSDDTEQEREKRQNDHVEGLYLSGATLYCDPKYLGQQRPEQGSRLRICRQTGFVREFYVVAVGMEMGLLCLELQEVQE